MAGGARRRRALFLAALVVGVGARLAVATLGHNFDVLSWTLVARIVEDGGNVYAETSRYNYAPPWSFVVHQLAVWASAFPSSFVAFKWLLTIFLTLTDIALALLLLERVGKRAALLFFLNPISVIISGYHRQFDNIAVLLGLLAVAALDDPDRRARTWLGAGFLGVSLAVKHVLFAFPLWLAVREQRWRDRLIVLIVPVVLFVAGFIPYWKRGAAGIVANVLLYRVLDQGTLWRMLLPASILSAALSTVLFLAVLTGAAFALRRLDRQRAFFVYLVLLVACAPAISNQALAIVVPTTAVFPNPPFALFTAAATAHLITDPQGFDLVTLRRALPIRVFGHGAQALLLVIGLLWLLLGERPRGHLSWIRSKLTSRAGAGAQGHGPTPPEPLNLPHGDVIRSLDSP